MTNAVSTICRLPDDCLLCIFGQLAISDRLLLRVVCKRWWHLCTRSLKNVRRLHFDKFFNQPYNPTHSGNKTALLYFINNFGSNLRFIKTTTYHSVPLGHDVVGAIKAQAKSIERLDVSFTFVVANICPLVKSVKETLRALSMKEAHFAHVQCKEHIQHVIPILRNLEHLDIGCYYKRTPPFTIDRLQIDPRATLTFLDVSGFRWITAEQLIATLHSVAKLRSLNLSRLSSTLDQRVVECVATLKHLKELSIRDIHADHLDFTPLCRLYNLEILYAGNNLSLRSEVAQMICHSCSNLRIFERDPPSTR